MRVVITGGAGFLGSHLCELLLAAGHKVCCVDSLITGRLENVAAFRVVHHPLPVDDPKCRRPDISRARCPLNWEPCGSLEQGLDRTITYFRRV